MGFIPDYVAVTVDYHLLRHTHFFGRWNAYLPADHNESLHVGYVGWACVQSRDWAVSKYTVTRLHFHVPHISNQLNDSILVDDFGTSDGLEKAAVP